MSLQTNSLDSGRSQCGARSSKTKLLQRFGAKATGHLPVFREFSGRLVHLAIQIKEDMVTSTRDRS